MANISNSANNTLIVGTSDGDSIINSGSGVTIDAYAGNDDIFIGSFAASVLVNVGDG